MLSQSVGRTVPNGIPVAWFDSHFEICSLALKFPTPTNTLMRLSHVLVAIAATFVVTSEASSSITGSTSTETSRVAVSGGPSQRMLRTHHNTYGDDEDDEERGLTPKAMESMKSMKAEGKTVDDYAKELGIAEKMQGFKTNSRGYQAFLHTDKYQDYIGYFNYLQTHKKKQTK
ncbi:hypothetical protein BBJ29_009403 [Phytophthora kernoviae]|uniref:PexRD2 WYL domain-containing protein n=1 Tax=Phytophthora kernoviae TaxID=325452 RepID=A0A3F2RYW5_9STRA|nr:hypothetical protein BBJ29_009403 [Phytophthora kernoviae]RLN66098.1 hypothetical protein BBP00_00002456 [Phytophthora kernoviae]